MLADEGNASLVLPVMDLRRAPSLSDLLAGQGGYQTRDFGINRPLTMRSAPDHLSE